MTCFFIQFHIDELKYKNYWCIYMLFFLSILLFFIFLTHPASVFLGASEGVLLWFHTVLPTLFPFFVITSLLISSNALSLIKNPAWMAIIGGFSCGYPMGGKIISDLWHNNYIKADEAQFLLSFCNNASPMFISSYFIIQCLNVPKLVIPSITILFLSPVICSFIFRIFHSLNKSMKEAQILPMPKTPRSAVELFDLSITNSMENIVKIGGYIIFFSILFKLCYQYLGNSMLLRYLVIPSLEITNCLKSFSKCNLLLFWQKYTLMMGHLSFGGICAIFQTKCVLKDTPVSLFVYTIEKLITALVTSLLSYLYIGILY